MEADFLREYSLDLTEPGVLEGMTWRSFMVRVRGLSPNSATSTALRIGHVASKDHVQFMDTPEKAQAAFARLFPNATRRVS